MAGSGWTLSETPGRFAATGMTDISQPINLGSGLPKGSYTFEFTVDNVVNGAFDSVWTDAVMISVQ